MKVKTPTRAALLGRQSPPPRRGRKAKTCRVCCRVTDDLDAGGQCNDRVICNGRAAPLDLGPL